MCMCVDVIRLFVCKENFFGFCSLDFWFFFFFGVSHKPCHPWLRRAVFDVKEVSDAASGGPGLTGVSCRRGPPASSTHPSPPAIT